MTASLQDGHQLLRAEKCNVEDFKFTTQSKQFVCDQLRVAFEQGNIAMPTVAGESDQQLKRQALWLKDEIEYFEPYLQGGRMKLGARGEHHDDILAAIMMALYASSQKPPKFWHPELLKIKEDNREDRIWQRMG